MAFRRDRSAAATALDTLEVLLRWCRDPVLAEPMEGFVGFADAVRRAEIALENARSRGWEAGVEFDSPAERPGRKE